MFTTHLQKKVLSVLALVVSVAFSNMVYAVACPAGNERYELTSKIKKLESTSKELHTAIKETDSTRIKSNIFALTTLGLQLSDFVLSKNPLIQTHPASAAYNLILGQVKEVARIAAAGRRYEPDLETAQNLSGAVQTVVSHVDKSQLLGNTISTVQFIRTSSEIIELAKNTSGSLSSSVKTANKLLVKIEKQIQRAKTELVSIDPNCP